MREHTEQAAQYGGVPTLLTAYLSSPTQRASEKYRHHYPYSPLELTMTTTGIIS